MKRPFIFTVTLAFIFFLSCKKADSPAAPVIVIASSYIGTMHYNASWATSTPSGTITGNIDTTYVDTLQIDSISSSSVTIDGVVYMHDTLSAFGYGGDPSRYYGLARFTTDSIYLDRYEYGGYGSYYNSYRWHFAGRK